MTCYLMIKELEKKMGRKLTEKEKKEVEKKLHPELSQGIMEEISA